jgi:hypothetical protein
VADHVGEDAAEVLGQVLPPRDAVGRFTGGGLGANSFIFGCAYLHFTIGQLSVYKCCFVKSNNFMGS